MALSGITDPARPAKTALVFAGGGSFGAIQVGMLHSLAAHGIYRRYGGRLQRRRA